MNEQEKLDLLNQYVKGPQEIQNLIKDLNKEAIFFKKDKDYWSIQENIIHLLDGDMNSYIRYRMGIAEPQTGITKYDENKWTGQLRYERHDRLKALTIFSLLREFVFEHLLSLINEDWTQYQYAHPDLGLVNLEQWVKLMIDHVEFHKKLIQRNIRAFEAKK